MKSRLWLASAAFVWLGFGAPAYAAFDSADAAKEKDLHILKVTPEGEDVPAGRQIVITFNRPVVPIGKMERKKEDLPITIAPDLNCQWRWINTSSLACELDEKTALAPATKYEIEIKPGIRAEDGATIAEAYKSNFITERPDTRYAWFRTWKSPGYPVMRVTFNQSVSKESVEEHLFIAHADNTSGRWRIDAEPDPDDRELPDIIPVPGTKGALFGTAIKQKSDDDVKLEGGIESRRVWILSPEKELDLDTTFALKVDPGLHSALGPERGVGNHVVVQFDTFPEFAFIGVKCVSNSGHELLVTPGKSSTDLCDPLARVALAFTSPVLRSHVKKQFDFTPDLAGGRKDLDPWGNTEENEYSRLTSPHKKGNDYEVWLPGGLKAAQKYMLATRPRDLNFFERIWLAIVSIFSSVPKTDLTDEFGRELTDAISMSFATDHRRPNFELVHHDAVLEKSIDSEVPLYVNNLEKFGFSFRAVTAAGALDNQTTSETLAKAEDVQFAVPVGVRKMLGGESGAVFGYLNTTPSVVNKDENDYRLFAEVTPYQMHVKLGHFSTLVWVSDLQSGQPVEGAKVTIYKDALTTMGKPADVLATATSGKDGIAILPGTATIDPQLELSRRWKDSETRLFVRVDKGKDMAVMPITGAFLIDMYRASGETVYCSNRKQYGHMRAWGTTAQGIYRAGDTIQYKFYVRAQDDNTLIPAPKEGYTLKIIDPTGKKVHQVKGVKLSEFGAYSGEFTVPEHGAVGWYQFKLAADFNKKKDAKDDDDEQDNAGAGNDAEGENEGEGYDQPETGSGKITLMPMRVLVSDFTPVPFKVTSELNGDLFHTDQPVEVSTAAKLHSGGAYTQASARVTALLNNSAFMSKDPVAKAFTFDTTRQDRGERQVFQKIEPLTDKGELKTNFTIPKQDIIYGRLTVESAVQDDRGKYVAAQSQADYIAVDRLVGMRQTEWLYKTKQEAKIDYMVVDERGVPAKGTKVDLLVEKQITKSARVKGAGNAYITNFTTEWKESGKCSGTSDEAPQTCGFTPDEAGVYRVTASIKDTKGNDHSSQTSLWVVGSDYVVWNDESDTALQIVSEKATYNVGDTARYLIKNPYPGAKALITVERYGIIDHFVQTLEGSTPVISIPVKPDYLPGFYLSVVVISPRVEKPVEDGQVDLGKPAFRMGYVAVPVKDPYKEMLVTAKTDRDIYKPRDKVKMTLHAEPKHTDKKEPIEIAVAVLDESVFDLITGGKSYYDPYAGFYSLDSLDLRNYSLLTRLIGRQKFEKKGANPGGDGGSDLSMRSLFKFVSYWNPGIKADKNGNASAEFEVPDNLTGWRILAIATTPSDRVGLGDANFKVNRPTEVRPVMPNQVSESDHFNAGFSVMNRTDKPRDIKVTIDAEGTLDKDKVHHEETVNLGAYKRTIITMPLVAGRVDAAHDVPHGDIHFAIRASDATDGDGMEHTLPVNKLRSLETAANYGTTTTEKAEESIAFPDNIHTDIGSVSVVVAPSVIGNVVGAFKYLRDYPYICWEQILTKGVMASHYKNLRAYLPESFTWKEAEGMPESVLKSAAAFQAPNGGMCYFIADDRFADPYLSTYTALAFNWLRHSGYTIPDTVENKLHGYLLDYLKRDAAPEFYSEGMNSTVRAVALAALAENKKIGKADIDRYRPHVKQMSLFGKTYFMLAAMLVGDEDETVTETAKAILAHANETGGKFVFNEELDDSYSRILSSPMRENCAILDVFTQLGETPQGKDIVNDMPFKLVRTITQTRGGRDYWQNTQENMFCMNALIDYSRIYEKVKPAMKVTASMDDKSFGKTEFKDLRDKSATFERPIVDGDSGRKGKVVIEKNGDGRLYYATRLSYAPKSGFTTPTNAGIEIHREYSVERNNEWVLLKNPEEIKRGELVRVDLFLSLAAARNFVVVDDPVPGGLEPVNRDLANSSMVDANKGDFKAAGGSWWFKFSDWRSYNTSRWSFYHQELRHDSVHFYSDYLPAGNYHLSYTAQAIAEGQFTTMPEMAQEMYDPDVYGKGVLEQLVVKAPEEPKQAAKEAAKP